MARPHKRRNIEFNPTVKYFKPRGIPMKDLEEVVLSHDETEALRLRYVEGLEQSDAAEQMEISQSTFHRILASANKKLAEGIIKGKAICIEE